MQIKSEQLAQWLLGKEVETIRLAWIYGDDPILVDETANHIRQSLEKIFPDATLSEDNSDLEPISKEVFGIDAKFDWQEIRNRTQQASLFSPLQFLDLRLYVNKVNAEAISILTDFASSEKSTHFLLLTSPRLDAKLLQSKGFKKLAQRILVVPVWPLKDSGYINWLRQKAKEKQLHFEPNAFSWLANHTEGNLLTALQLMEQLHISREAYPNPISVQDLEQQISYSARLSIFDIIQRVYYGDTSHLSLQLDTLKAAGELPIRILAALQKELGTLAELKACATNQELIAGLKRNRVFGPKQQATKKLINRIHEKDLMDCFSLCHRLDQSIKGVSNESSWDLLSRILLRLSGHKLDNLQILNSSTIS